MGPLCVGATRCPSQGIPSDARFLFCGSDSGHIYCWCLLTGNLLSVFKAHLQAISCLTMTEDGNLLISGSADCLCKVWKLAAIVVPSTRRSAELNSGVCAVKEWAVWKEHILGITAIECPNNQRVFTASKDCTVKIYSLLNRQLVSSMTFPAPISALAVDPANVHLLVTSAVGHFWRIDLVQHPTFGMDSDISAILEAEPKSLLSDITFDTVSETKTGGKTKASARTLGITGCGVSYDGRLAVCSHCNGTASLWDIKYGSKVAVLSKQRARYDAVHLVCDRLGAFAQSESDVKYQKFAMLTRNFPVRFKRHFASDAVESKESVFNIDAKTKGNKTPLVFPPEFLSINIPSGICSAAELAVNERQKKWALPQLGFDWERNGHRTAKYGRDSWWSDEALLGRISDESERMRSFNGNADGAWIETAGGSVKEQRRVQGMAESGNAAVDRTIGRLLEENQRLRGELGRWKELNKDLYQCAVRKLSGTGNGGMRVFQ